MHAGDVCTKNTGVNQESDIDFEIRTRTLPIDFKPLAQNQGLYFSLDDLVVAVLQKWGIRG